MSKRQVLIQCLKKRKLNHLEHCYFQQAMKQPPFNDFLGQYLVQILSPRREAAFLYDAVKLYTKSLKESLENGEDVFNGTRIIERLKKRSYTRCEIIFLLICCEK